MGAEKVATYTSILVGVMKQNSTLQIVKLRNSPNSNLGNATRKAKVQMNYLLALNVCGRKQAVDPRTTLAEFVALLDSVAANDRSVADRSWRHHSLDMGYGLLRQAVSKWVR